MWFSRFFKESPEHETFLMISLFLALTRRVMTRTQTAHSLALRARDLHSTECIFNIPQLGFFGFKISVNGSEKCKTTKNCSRSAEFPWACELLCTFSRILKPLQNHYESWPGATQSGSGVRSSKMHLIVFELPSPVTVLLPIMINQQTRNWEWMLTRPVAYASRTLSNVEQRY